MGSTEPKLGATLCKTIRVFHTRLAHVIRTNVPMDGSMHIVVPSA